MLEIIAVKDLKDATPEELADLRRKGFLPATGAARNSERLSNPYERTKAHVMASGNKWAIENFNATHN